MAIKQNVIDDFNILSGQQKAAILMLSLDEERSASIFALMDDEEIKELSVIMASLGKVNSNVVEQLFSEFVEKVSSTGSLVGTYESTERLLSKALDKDRVSNIMEEIRGPAGRTMWDKLGNVNEHVLANYLKNEYPQTIAVILSKIKAEHAAKVIALLPENFAMAVTPVMRVLLVVLKPINAVFSGWKKLLCRVFHFEKDRTFSQDELLTLVDEVQQEGSIDRDEGELLKNAIGFSEQTAEDILMHLLDGGFSSAAHLKPTRNCGSATSICAVVSCCAAEASSSSP